MLIFFYKKNSITNEKPQLRTALFKVLNCRFSTMLFLKILFYFIFARVILQIIFQTMLLFKIIRKYEELGWIEFQFGLIVSADFQGGRVVGSALIIKENSQILSFWTRSCALYRLSCSSQVSFIACLLPGFFQEIKYNQNIK